MYIYNQNGLTAEAASLVSKIHNESANACHKTKKSKLEVDALGVIRHRDPAGISAAPLQ